MAPRLQANIVNALLGDSNLPTARAMMTVKVDQSLINQFDLTQQINSPPIEGLIVSVAQPVGMHLGRYVASVSFRKPHHVLPKGDGIATFGDTVFEEDTWLYGSPLDGAGVEF